MTTASGRRGWERRWPAVLAWALWALAMLGIAAVFWFDQLLRQAGRADLAQVNASGLSWLLALVTAPTVGAVLASRRPRHPVGWLLLGLGVSIGLAGFADGFAPYGLLAQTLTPEPLEPAYRPVTNPLGFRVLELPITIAHVVASGVTVVAVVVGALSLVVRFRRARGTERQQLRWVALAAVLASLAILVALAGMASGNAALLVWAAGVSFAVLPLAIGAAVARYRLYDLDRIVSRTLAYGLVTVVLAGGYAAVVLVLGQLLGRDSSLVVAAATLAVAALFQPARRRIQALVDRRFNRRRYDAARTIAAFSGRLREQVDLATLTAELLAVADQTMQPTRASMWLRPQGPPDAAARTAVSRLPAVEGPRA